MIAAFNAAVYDAVAYDAAVARTGGPGPVIPSLVDADAGTLLIGIGIDPDAATAILGAAVDPSAGSMLGIAVDPDAGSWIRQG